MTLETHSAIDEHLPPSLPSCNPGMLIREHGHTAFETQHVEQGPPPPCVSMDVLCRGFEGWLRCCVHDKTLQNGIDD